MKLRNPIRSRFFATTLAAFLSASSTLSQQKPVFAIDLKPLGVAPDLFTDQSGSKYPQRGVISLFWLGNDHLAVAFSTNRRWSAPEKPEPLHVRLLIFDTVGKQLNDRDWDFSADGPEADTTLEFLPGTDNSILAVHESNAAGKIPEGDFIQVLNPDTSLRQNFYVPATSALVRTVSPNSSLALQTFYANKHSSLAWWSGSPLKPGAKLELPFGDGEILAGPEVAARADCPTAHLCSGIRVFGPGKNAWMYTLSEPDTVPLPRAFFDPTALLVELRYGDRKQVDLLVAHSNGKRDPLPAIPHGLQVLGVTSVSVDSQRLSLDAGGEVGVCGGFDFWCKQRGEAAVIDIPSNKIIFEQEITVNGGTSALSPDGKRIAIFDRNKLSVYEVR